MLVLIIEYRLQDPLAGYEKTLYNSHPTEMAFLR